MMDETVLASRGYAHRSARFSEARQSMEEMNGQSYHLEQSARNLEGEGFVGHVVLLSAFYMVVGLSKKDWLG